MAILTTIHSPSAEVFNLFDRIIIISEGHTIFNDTPLNASPFLKKLNIKFGRYVNPADWLIKLANDPQSVNPELTVEKLAELSSKDYRHVSEIERSTMFGTGLVNKNFIRRGRERSVGFFRQFRLLWMRQFMYTYRNRWETWCIIATCYYTCHIYPFFSLIYY